MKEYRGDYMASTSSINSMRLTGLSGFDTESIVQQLMEAEKVKVSRFSRKGRYSFGVRSYTIV